MLIIKCFGSCLVLISCVLFGYVSKEKTLLAIRELENFVICIDIFNVEVQNGLLNIFDAFKVSCDHASNLNKEIFTSFLNMCDDITSANLYELWKTNLNNSKSKQMYNKDEIGILSDFGKLLGLGSGETQGNNVEMLKNSLNTEIKKRREIVLKKDTATKIYLYTGILIIIILW